MILKNFPLEKAILLIRHGESEHMTQGVRGGSPASPLTQTGRQQIGLLAQRLAGELGGIPSRLVCSRMQRAIESAEIISKGLDLSPETIPDLNELDTGKASGKPKAKAQQMYTPPTDPLWDWRPYPGAENWREFHIRVAGTMDRLYPAQDNRLLIVTAHQGTIINILYWWTELKAADLARTRLSFHTDPASLSLLVINEWQERTLCILNDTSHLASLEK